MTTKEEYERMIEARRTFLDSLNEIDLGESIPYIDGDILDNSHLLVCWEPTEEQAEAFKIGTGEEPPVSKNYILDMNTDDNSFYMWESGELRGRTYGGDTNYFYEEDVLEGSLPVYIVDNPLDMMIVKSTKKAEAIIILSPSRESLLSFFKMWKDRTEGQLPPVIIRLESSKSSIIRTEMISKAFEEVLGYEPMISTEGRERYESLRDKRKEIENELKDVQIKRKMAESKKDEEALPGLKEEEDNLKDFIGMLDLEKASTLYGLINLGEVDFRSIVDEIKELIDDDREKKEAKRREAYRYLQTATAPAMGDFLEDLRLHAREYIPTGFINIDRKLGGGWEEGNLYVIGAESSIGKTSLLLQIGDNLSKAGADVLFFSLEMSRKELMAKSLSRVSFEKIVMEKAPLSLDGWLQEGDKSIDFYDRRLNSWSYYIENKGFMDMETLVANALDMEETDDMEDLEKSISAWSLPKSFSNILHKAPTWDEETYAFMRECGEKYSKEINSVYIIENSTAIDPMSNGRPTIDTIEKAISQHKKNMETEGRAPRPLVVCLDYLQLMKMEPTETGKELSDKQAVDEAMSRLRNIASDSEAIIIVLSSLNRTSYNKPVHIESLKESGGVEYGADKIVGMEPSGFKEPKGGSNDNTISQNIQVMKAFKQTEGKRVVKIEILKNRGGALGYTYLSNVGMFGYFADTKETGPTERQQSIDTFSKKD